jgi:hypothetical protein
VNDSTSILFGMPEIAVVKVERVAGDGEKSGTAGAYRTL